MTLDCVSDAVSAMKVWKDQAGNFLNRKKRIEKQLKIMDGKFSKRLDFSSISDNITFVGGGDSANLPCYGSNTSSKALTLGSLKTKIDSCNATIGTDCNSTLVMMNLSLNSTELEDCFNITTNYTVQADICMDSEAPCECWGALVNGEIEILFLLIIYIMTFQTPHLLRSKRAVLPQRPRRLLRPRPSVPAHLEDAAVMKGRPTRP